MFQPVAQTLANASAPQDLVLPWAGAPDIGLEKVLVPFVRQAGLCIATYGENLLICRISRLLQLDMLPPPPDAASANNLDQRLVSLQLPADWCWTEGRQALR